MYRLRARSWVRDLGPTGRALEIGCGSGWMLQALHRQGWRVVGNERTVQSVAYAWQMNGVPAFVGSLDALKPASQFDLIVLFQVLEHLQDPIRVLRDCAKLLKVGGTLIVAVPNFESWQARTTGTYWFHLDVPRHLFHFSSRSLSRALGVAGLSISRKQFISLEHDPYGWVQSLLNALGFEQNLLTKILMGADPRNSWSLSGIAMAVVAFLLLIPSLVLAVGSWLAGAGASMEVMAIKDLPEQLDGQITEGLPEAGVQRRAGYAD